MRLQFCPVLTSRTGRDRMVERRLLTNTRWWRTTTRPRWPAARPRTPNCRAAVSSCSGRCWEYGHPCWRCPAVPCAWPVGASIWTTAGRSTCGSSRTARRTGSGWRPCWAARTAGPWWSGATAGSSPCPPCPGCRPRR